jgi:predicted RNA methylase
MNNIIAIDRTTIRRNITLTGKPEAGHIDALIRNGFKYDERAQQWWKLEYASATPPVSELIEELDCKHVTLRELLDMPAPERDEHQYRYQSYYTPDWLAKELVTIADIRPGMACLEPSAGMGAIADIVEAAGGKVVCVEADPEAYSHLCGAHTAYSGDFLSMDSTPAELGTFDRVVMNPPFSRDQDARHVCHAFTFLKPGGRLVAIVGHYALNGKTDERRRFQDLIRQYGRIVKELPPGTFENNARAVIVELNRHEA